MTVYLALVGPPGTGKGVATNIAARIVNVDGLKTITPSSGEGLVESYYRMPDEGDDPKGKVRDHRPVLVIYDELTRLVEVGQRATSSLYDVTLTGWTGADLTTTNAEAKRTREVKAGTYRLGMIASAQFGPTAAILAKSDLGMPQRFLFSDVTPPVSAVEVLSAFDAASAASRRSGWPTAPPAKDAP